LNFYLELLLVIVTQAQLHYRQHVGEMRSNAAETGSGQARFDAGDNQQLFTAAQGIP